MKTGHAQLQLSLVYSAGYKDGTSTAQLTAEVRTPIRASKFKTRLFLVLLRKM